MRRFFVPHIDISKNESDIIDPVQIHHIKDVLRFKPNDEILLFDANGNEYECQLRSFQKDKIIAKVIKKKTKLKTSEMIITLACAIPKKGRFDTIIEKATELGVDRIIPIVTNNSIVRLENKNLDNKLARWRRIAIEASKQCGRAGVPLIENPQEFKNFASRFGEFDVILLPNLSSPNRTPIVNAIERISEEKSILLLIGPEGDFSESEIRLAKAQNALMISLGSRVLRVETAAIICAGILCLNFKQTLDN